MDLFDLIKDKKLETSAPLADKMRPRNLKEILGQDHILGYNKFLYRCIRSKKVPSVILYGPPGTGKTTIAKAISQEVEANFFQLNAVTSGVKEIREVIERAEYFLEMDRGISILFIDEIHRFSKNQQDALLPHVEKGIITLIGATTENPYFQVNNALLSRVTVLKLETLDKKDILNIIDRVLKDEQYGLGKYDINISKEAMDHIADIANGDARRALNAIEIAALSTYPNDKGQIIIDLEVAIEAIQRRTVQYDGDGDQHYDVISAFIKSIRGSDPDATLHYLAKMIHAGEDVEYIARRLIISASEDIGNADPQALQVAVSAHNALKIIGMPEGRIILSQASTYLATAPKSNASYMAIDKALNDIDHIKTTVPDFLKDSHYKGAEKFGHGIGYLYPHDYKNNFISQEYLPKELKNRKYYLPTRNGFEKDIVDYMNKIKTTDTKS